MAGQSRLGAPGNPITAAPSEWDLLDPDHTIAVAASETPCALLLSDITDTLQKLRKFSTGDCFYWY
jgi:hypothetical protein